MARARVMEPQFPIWIPGRGTVDMETWRIAEELHRYDERLVLARNEDNGQWCVFTRMPRGGFWPELLPVLGLTEPPHDARSMDLRDVMRRVINSDTARQGQKILDDLVHDNEALRAQQEYEMEQITGETAEVMASALMRAGQGPTSMPVRRLERKQRWDGG